jgi:hypothetical protein
LHRQHYDARIVHQRVRAYITTPICNISDALPPGPEPAGPEPPRAGAARPEIIVEPTSFASLALGIFCHKKIYQSF